MEIGLLVQVILHRRSLQLCPPTPQHAASAAAAGAPQSAATPGLSGGGVQAPAGAAPAATTATATAGRPLHQELIYIVSEVSMGFVDLFFTLFKVMGGETAKWSFGLFDTHVEADGPMQAWTTSGDPQSLLPPCELRRLVGVKLPASPCMVEVAFRG